MIVYTPQMSTLQMTTYPSDLQNGPEIENKQQEIVFTSCSLSNTNHLIFGSPDENAFMLNASIVEVNPQANVNSQQILIRGNLNFCNKGLHIYLFPSPQTHFLGFCWYPRTNML